MLDAGNVQLVLLIRDKDNKLLGRSSQGTATTWAKASEPLSLNIGESGSDNENVFLKV